MHYNISIPPLETLFTYKAPDDLGQHKDLTGYKVLVPFGKRKVYGYVIERADQHLLDTAKIKEILELVGQTPVASQELLNLCRWISRYYAEPLSQVLENAIPAIILNRDELWVSINSAEQPNKKAQLQSEIYQYVKESGGACKVEELTKKWKSARSTLKSMQKKSLISYQKKAAAQVSSIATEQNTTAIKIVLTEQQETAVNKILNAANENKFETFLLHGVTGSGKTEVYLECVKALREQQKSCLIIVPEISLTPQVVERFTARLGSKIAVLHSSLSQRERSNFWQSLVIGQLNIVIGVRSAIFAPLENLGLIIIDEEHDSSFKQSDNFRYHARDLALVRAKLAKCPVVLGSATPALESYYLARKGRAHYLHLPQQSNYASKVNIELVDLNKTKPWEMVSPHISPAFYDGLASCIAKGEQAFILYNRRGFANYLQCKLCNNVLSCPNCCVSLTYHKKSNLARCHYCDYKLSNYKKCTECAINLSLSQQDKDKAEYQIKGAGTERIFDEIKQLFPKVVVERLDRDSVNSVDDYKKVLGSLKSGTAQVLVGTQMIAKGHDLPNVTFVGVADSDLGLHLPDFRASERVFQLLTQVAGRAGRREKIGRVVFQTRLANHHALKFAQTRNYESFALTELRERKNLNYPPYSRLLRIVASSENSIGLSESLIQIKRILLHYCKNNGTALNILGPAPCPLERLRNRCRHHLIVKASSPAILSASLAYLKSNFKKQKNIRVTFDLDAFDML